MTDLSLRGNVYIRTENGDVDLGYAEIPIRLEAGEKPAKFAPGGVYRGPDPVLPGQVGYEAAKTTNTREVSR